MVRSKVVTNAVSIYLRVSTEEQSKSGLGIEAQLELCKSVCERFNYEIAGVFTELGVSGKTQPLERPQFQSAIALAKKTKGRIMVAKLDRLSRNLHQATGFLDNVYDCPEILIAENPTASMLELRLKALIAQEERDMISARTKAALEARKARGEISNGTVGRKVHVEKATAATKDAVTRAKELKSQGYSYQKIADVLNVEGFTTSSGGSWHKQSIHRWLNKQ
ncbi:site-specific recombinase for integration and excision [Tolypothrix sp. NIES-4075]|uniref:recombinase family protein n=1 Tax=Tolypothrix sp. NIES-4075 TaxID=2005459 RepID=UPI000B5C6AD0|nr:recombinase family protein [Tolypothrix sp. NIES-4075]GAX46263.1 site-specific recombinase for integration and excision [Tolypothrix sp. NIES-4075]